MLHICFIYRSLNSFAQKCKRKYGATRRWISIEAQLDHYSNIEQHTLVSRQGSQQERRGICLLGQGRVGTGSVNDSLSERLSMTVMKEGRSFVYADMNQEGL